MGVRIWKMNWQNNLWKMCSSFPSDEEYNSESMASMKRLLNGAPWTFNNHLLVIHRLEDGEDLMKSMRAVLMSSVCLREEGEGELGEGNQGRSDLGRAF
ncbi:hypothetical protein Goshw_026805 [Gossypium schwendimanii]|uniref:DUF4283 domain-containing protein n=1 Tax=Gossypium schwendimanii TaxID=34291 RepID=A0A7J9L5U1_GOSSC|nr:hypothetical protein [Gossypium schwendimanii]